jgi:hypothetical protein
MPQRIQLSRRKGWRKPAGAVVVSRPTKWGNPFKVGQADPFLNTMTLGRVVAVYRLYLLGGYLGPGRTEANAYRELRGKDLACWCPPPALGKPDLCHAAVLLEIANR